MKALIVYGSERGGTAGLARMIGEAFRTHGWEVDVRAAEVVKGIDDPDVVVVGGALYANRWHKAARRFVKRHREALAQIPTWLFSSGPLDDSARSGGIAPVPGVQALAQAIEARGHMTFGGRLEKDTKGFVARSMARRYAGDWRDRHQVDEWVHLIVRESARGPVELPQPRSGEPGQTPQTSAGSPGRARR